MMLIQAGAAGSLQGLQPALRHHQPANSSTCHKRWLCHVVGLHVTTMNSTGRQLGAKHTGWLSTLSASAHQSFRHTVWRGRIPVYAACEAAYPFLRCQERGCIPPLTMPGTGRDPRHHPDDVWQGSTFISQHAAQGTTSARCWDPHAGALHQTTTLSFDWTPQHGRTAPHQHRHT